MENAMRTNMQYISLGQGKITKNDALAEEKGLKQTKLAQTCLALRDVPPY